jgi:replicative DNA helicase
MTDLSPQRQPHNPKAEQAVLGAILKNRDVILEVGQTLKPDDFYVEKHRLIYRSMLALSEASRIIDTVTLCEHLSSHAVIDQAGGPEYVGRLETEVPAAVRYEHYAEIVREKATRRRLISAANESILSARDEAGSIEETADTVAQRFLDLATGAAQEHTRSIKEVVGEVIDEVEELAARSSQNEITGVSSGFFALDKKTAGWQSSDLIILAGRPGMGKTAFALELLRNSVLNPETRKAALFFSLEMSASQLTKRVISSHARLKLQSLRLGSMSTKERDRFHRGIEEVSQLPIFIHDRSPMTVAEIARIARKKHHEEELGLILIDYLQLMQGSALKRNQSREQEISEISRKLKSLAKELDIPVIALSQLNRSVENRENKIPRLSDLRESGAIEQDADIIIFLYREAYYEELEAKKRGADEASIERERKARGQEGDETKIVIAKHRSGETGIVSLRFIPKYVSFANYATDVPPPDDEDIAPDRHRLGEGRTTGGSAGGGTENLKSPPPQPDGTSPPPRRSQQPSTSGGEQTASTGIGGPAGIGDLIDEEFEDFVEVDEDDDDIPY